ncbi:stem cell self-renewal protein Piwi domain-containing protein [Tautonia sociabilis]|uniref:Protein argonaute n=2 Tax=Tautonia sociabilis TaxID=2080755 RepID=A0A432MEQ5_9BACT|nr:stem cell self-renewal protein Piwi domain-containing protein [Tautonia sociabilis]
MKALRTRYGKEWFLHWRGGRAYCLPRADEPSEPIGKMEDLSTDVHDHLHLVVARLNDVLPDVFPQYEAFRRRPFSFLGRKDEIVRLVTKGWPNLHPLVNEFKISPQFELDPRIIEVRKGETSAAVVLRIGMKWQVLAPLDRLKGAGIDLSGLAVVRRNPAVTERRLVGTIASVGANVELAEAFDDLKAIPINQVWLEGSKASFTRCLRALLGPRFEDFESARHAREGEFLLGPALDKLLGKMGEFLTNASPIRLSTDFSCTIRDRVELNNSGDYQSVVKYGDVEYCFDAAKSKRNIIPWSGLMRFGPFSRDTFSKRTPRVLVVCPDQSAGKVSQFVRAFRDGIQSVPNSKYPKGFAGTFGLVNPEFVTCTVPLLGTADNSAAMLYRRSIEDHLACNQESYDAAVVALLDHHARLPDQINPYLHAKGTLLLNGIPTQEVRHATLSARPEALQWSIQNLAVALYAKMGGTPWTVAHDQTVDDEIVIGLGAAELTGSRFESRHRFMGITTVFRGDGNYLLSNVSRVCSYEDYPDVLRTTTTDVLKELKQRNDWRDGDIVRVVFHAHRPFKKIEVARIAEECVHEAARTQDIQFAFLTVSHDHPFKLIDDSQKGITKPTGVKGRYAPARGTVAQLGRHTRLLCTNGPHQIKRPTTPLPSPVLIHLHRESGYKDLQYLTEQILKFTSLTWRSTQPASDPVTIYYSELISALLARLQEVPGWSPAILNTKLRSSRWFL